jgi:predicted nucleic acid-binding Zn ribbon protein
MRRIQEIVGAAIDREEVLKVGRAQRIFRRWAEIVGPALAERSRPDRYDHGTVWVAVTGSSWAQELRMRKDQILSRMREMSGEPELFQRLRFGVRPLPEWESEAQTQQEKPTVEPNPEIRQLSIREIAERRLKKMKDEGRA